MNEWVIAEWIDEDGRIRAPSYQGLNGKWYRAGVSDYGGPTILMMDSEPVEVTRIQGASPQRRPESYEFHRDVRQIQARQEEIATALGRIEHVLARVHGPWSSAVLPPPSYDNALTPMVKPVLGGCCVAGAATYGPSEKAK